MAKYITLVTQDAGEIPEEIKPQKSIPRYIIITHLKTKDKENLLKADREK